MADPSGQRVDFALQKGARTMECPNCRSTSVFKSKSGNARLIWPLRMFVVRLRCHNCSKMFYRRGALAGGEKVPPSPTSQAKSSS